MANQIKAIVKYPGKEPELRKLTDTLETYQNIVGGYIECFALEEGVTLICNEEGHLNDMQFNVWIDGYCICGPLVIVGTDGENFTDITRSRAFLWLNRVPWG